MDEAKRRIAQWKEGSNLDLNSLGLTELPSLPSKLSYLYCYNNQLTSLPPLPSSLEILYCWNNNLISLPSLPSSLIELWCHANQLTSLSSLPPNLSRLYCWNNQLTSLPSLPPSLTDLDCINNKLTSLPPLPSSLEELYCDNNQLEVDIEENESPQDYWNRLEEIQSKKRIINRTKELKEEIMKTFWHPTNVQKFLDMYGIDFEDYV